MKLFPLEPIGIGTPDVEALGSFVHRLSVAHGVSLSHLFQRVEFVARRSTRAPYRNLGQLSPMVSPNRTNKTLTEDLNIVMGRNDLAALSMILIAEISVRDLCEFSRTLHWCPACFEECRRAGHGGYYKLIWQFVEVDTCAVHLTSLRADCPSCHRLQDKMGYRADAIFCQQCGASLAASNTALARLPSEESTGADIAYFVSRLDQHIRHPIKPDAPRRFIKALYNHHRKRHTLKALYACVPRAEVLDLIREQREVSFRTLRTLAYQLKRPVEQLLYYGIHDYTEPLDLQDTDQPDFLRHSTRKKRDHRKIREKITSTIELSGPDMSLRQLARTCGVSTGYISYRYPHLKHMVIERWKRHRAAEKVRKEQEAASAVVAYLSNQPDGAFVSRKKTLKDLIRQTGLPKNVLREAVRCGYERLRPQGDGVCAI